MHEAAPSFFGGVFTNEGKRDKLISVKGAGIQHLLMIRGGDFAKDAGSQRRLIEEEYFAENAG